MATFSASESWLLTRRRAHATNVRVSPRMGVPVRGLTTPTQRGARRSRASMTARREGTSIVEFSDVVIAIIAPKVTNRAAPPGKQTAATPPIGQLLV